MSAVQPAESRASLDLVRAVPNTTYTSMPGARCSGLDSCNEPAEEWIGSYRLLEMLGEGGMGVVYLAEQTEPVQRRLALKLIRSNFESQEAALRFIAEQQAMARLSHPTIAQIFEGSTTEEGSPYFAMEYVGGIPVTKFCDEKRLSIKARLRLFITICRGVRHAHQQGIIHRDLKPANILVTEHEGHAVPKIIDFGIAKALDQPLVGIHDLTVEGTIGTPAYMSPESFGSQYEPDTRTDVYALGIILYELLTGNQPFVHHGVSVMEVMRQITDGDISLPSAFLETLEEEAALDVASRRQLSATALVRCVTGDLDWIIDRAVATDREERYSSVAELAADIERYLDDEPVAAGPSGLAYRLDKFAKRHRAGVAAAFVALCAILLGIVGIGVGLVHARRAEAEALAQAERAFVAEARAQQEAASSQMVSNFLVELFEVSDPSTERGHEITARELLDRGAKRIGRELADQPLVQARMMATLGTIHDRLGLHTQAEPLLKEALRIRRSNYGEHHPEVAESLVRLGELYHQQGRLDEAESALREGLAQKKILSTGVTDATLVPTIQALAAVHTTRGEFSRAEELLRGASAVAESIHGEDGEEARALPQNRRSTVKLTEPKS